MIFYNSINSVRYVLLLLNILPKLDVDLDKL